MKAPSPTASHAFLPGVPRPLTLGDLLYGFCSLCLLGAAIFIGLRNWRSASQRWFAATTLSLLVWTATLFLFNRSQEPALILILGRVNFAAIVLAVYAGYRFVQAVAGRTASDDRGWLLWETLGLTVLTALTPLVDQAETIQGVASVAGSHVTAYGLLFPVYLLHVVAYLAAIVRFAFGQWRDVRRIAVERTATGDQLLLIGSGVLATGGVSLVTNVLLPYAYSDFRWIGWGPLSTLLFLLAVAYAVAKHRLFDIRILVRKTLVLGLAMSVVLAFYSAVVVLVTDWFARESAGAVTRFTVLVIAFTFDPLRRSLEERVDHLLFWGTTRYRKAGAEKRLG